MVTIDFVYIAKGRNAQMAFCIAQQCLHVGEKSLKWQIKYEYFSVAQFKPPFGSENKKMVRKRIY